MNNQNDSYTLRNGQLKDLVESLNNQQLLKRDIVIPANCISLMDGKVQLSELPGDLFDEERGLEDFLGEFGISPSNANSLNPSFEFANVAMRQMAEKLKVPARFWDYLDTEHQPILDDMVSQLLQRNDNAYFLRTFAPGEGSELGRGYLRAFLSDSYKVIDHLDVLLTMFKAIKEEGIDVEVKRCNLTDKNMYVELISPQAYVEADELLKNYRANKGKDDFNGITGGFILRNSETGKGAYSIAPRAIIGKCDNGLYFHKDAMNKTHVGAQMNEGIQWSAETQEKELSLIKSMTKDAVKQFLSQDYLQKKVDELEGMKQQLKHPQKAVENVCKHLQVSQEEQEEVMNYFINGSDITNVGVVQALTLHANTQSDPDWQYELERKSLDLVADIPAKFDIN